LFLSAKLVDRKEIPPARAGLWAIELADQLNWCAIRVAKSGINEGAAVTRDTGQPSEWWIRCCMRSKQASAHSKDIAT